MQQRYVYKFFLLTSILAIGFVLLPELPAEAQRRAEKRKLFSRKKKRKKGGIFGFLFRRGKRCPDFSDTAEGSPKLSKRERRQLRKRNEEIAASANEKIRAKTSEEEEEVAEAREEKPHLDPPEPVSAGTETDIEVVSVPLPKAHVTPEPDTVALPEPEPAPTRTAHLSEATPAKTKAPTPEPETKPDKPKPADGALWYTSETAVAEKTADFSFSDDDTDFSEADHKLMEQLAQQYRYGFNIYLTERLSPTDLNAGRVETYRRMNRIKAMLTASYGVSPDAIFLKSRSSTDSTSRIEVELK